MLPSKINNEKEKQSWTDQPRSLWLGGGADGDDEVADPAVPVDQAQDNANQAMEDAKQRAEETADRAQSKWAQMKADAAARREDIKAKIDKRADERDAKAAAKEADWAELDASDAIDLAVYAVYDAQLAVLNALDARIYAEERATIAGT